MEGTRNSELTRIDAPVARPSLPMERRAISFQLRDGPLFRCGFKEEFRMDLRPTHRNENRSESARVRSSVRGTAKIVATLDEVRPWKSLVWDACFEPICVATSILVGRAVARDGV